MSDNRQLDPSATYLLREAAFILANNAVEGDQKAGKLSSDIHDFLNSLDPAQTEKCYVTETDRRLEFLRQRKDAWAGFLEADPDDSLALAEVEAIEDEIALTSEPQPAAAPGS